MRLHAVVKHYITAMETFCLPVNSSPELNYTFNALPREEETKETCGSRNVLSQKLRSTDLPMQDHGGKIMAREVGVTLFFPFSPLLFSDLLNSKTGNKRKQRKTCFESKLN